MVEVQTKKIIMMMMILIENIPSTRERVLDDIVTKIKRIF